MTMLNMKKKYAIACCSLLLVACNESFPGLYAPVVDEDNPHPEVIEDRMPIKLSATDPSFSIVTRGLGSFEDWGEEANRERWRKADFYVYAFLAKNHEFVGSVNYAGEEVNLMLHNDDGRTPYCLVKNRKAKFSEAPEPSLEWVRGEDGAEYQPYYSVSYPDYMFNFFIYHIDNAFVYHTVEEPSRVVMDIAVDGTQDIISGYAHATSADVGNLEDYDDESLYLMNYWKELVYSARTGHRHIHPRFFLKHQMTKLNFGVKGLSEENSDKIQVLAVGVKARVRGEFTVARDWTGGWSWDTETAGAPDLGIRWGEEKDTMFVATDQTPEGEFGAAYKQEKCVFDPMVTVDYNEESRLGEILVAPDDSYSIYVRYKMADRPNEIFTATYNKVGFAEEGKRFEPGKVYNVTLRIYGPQSIGLAVDNSGLQWEQGDDVDMEHGEDM